MICGKSVLTHCIRKGIQWLTTQCVMGWQSCIRFMTQIQIVKKTQRCSTAQLAMIGCPKPTSYACKPNKTLKKARGLWKIHSQRVCWEMFPPALCSFQHQNRGPTVDEGTRYLIDRSFNSWCCLVGLGRLDCIINRDQPLVRMVKASYSMINHG